MSTSKFSMCSCPGSPWRSLCVAVCLVGCVFGGCLAAGGDAGASTSGRTFYVDCATSHAGDGSAAHPLADLGSASKVLLRPGDRLLLRRGTSCDGMLQLRGGGTARNPVLVGAYGPGRARPKINGATAPAAVWLTDMSYTTVEDLQLANTGDSTHLHRGLYFTSSTGTVRNVTVRNLSINHVDSLDTFSDAKKSGGIVGQTLATSARFSDVLIEGNRINDVSRQGITLYGTTASARPAATQPWPQASTGVVIRDNVISQVQGDGIVALGTNRAVLEHNRLDRANLSGYDFASPQRNCSAGIWAWDANNTLIEDNVVSHMHFGPSTSPGSLNGCDGEAYDADGNQDGTVIQYNESFDNAGGFVLLCTSEGTAAHPNPEHRADIRFNLSVDDAATFNPSPCAGDFNAAVNNLDGIRIYDNTIVAATPQVTLELKPSPLTGYFGNFVFANNIVVATATTAATAAAPFPCGSACAHNLFEGMPTPSTATASVTGDPRFTNPDRQGTAPPAPGGFRLRPRSPAIGAGAVVPAGVAAPARRDFFGVTISHPPSIGFSER